MKKLFFLISAALILSSCSTNVMSDGCVSSGELNFIIINVKGCQYLYSGGGNLGVLFTHMGNCNNPIHNNKKDSLQ